MATGDSDRNVAAAVFDAYLRRPTRRRLARLVRHFHAHVWAMALRLTGDREDAADISQDLFLGLLLRPPAPGSVRSPRAFLTFRVLRLARRLTRAAARRAAREKAAARNVAADQGLPPDLEALWQAIGDLPEKTRTVIELRYLAGCRNREIAEVLEISERSVEEHLRQGRESLRERLGEAGAGLVLLDQSDGEKWEPVPPGHLDNLLRVVEVGRALSPWVAWTIYRNDEVDQPLFVRTVQLGGRKLAFALEELALQVGDAIRFRASSDEEGACSSGLLSAQVAFAAATGEGPFLGTFRRDDPNGDGSADLSDAIFTLGYLFQGKPAALSCPAAADSNDDDDLDLSDPVALLSYLFVGGTAPPSPSGVCGLDLTPGNLGCEGSPGCP